MISEGVIGALGISTMVVRPGDTGLAHGSSDLPILATAFLITLCESAANSAIGEFLEKGETTVLATFTARVHSSVGIGDEIRSSVTCDSYENNILTFTCEIHDSERLVASIIMERQVVERVSFLARSAAQSIISQQSQ